MEDRGIVTKGKDSIFPFLPLVHSSERSKKFLDPFVNKICPVLDILSLPLVQSSLVHRLILYYLVLTPMTLPIPRFKVDVSTLLNTHEELPTQLLSGDEHYRTKVGFRKVQIFEKIFLHNSTTGL